MMESSEWYTPPDILDAAREALGGDFDLDPATCVAANRVVRARSIFTAEHVDTDGLADDNAWSGRIWLNPPNPAKPWWRKLVRSAEPNVTSGVYMAYSIEQVQQSQGWTPGFSMLAFPICVPKTRVRFYRFAKDELAARRAECARRLRNPKRVDTNRMIRTGNIATKGEIEWIERLMDMDPTELVPGDAPTHSSAIIGVGADRGLFRRAFAAIGECT